MPLQVSLVSPEATLYEGEADMVVGRTLGGGDIAFLPGHAPFLGALGPWPVELVLPGGGRERFAVHGGFVEVSGDHVTILSDLAELPAYIDVQRAADAKRRAEEILRDHPENPEAVAALARAEVRLQVAGDV